MSIIYLNCDIDFFEPVFELAADATVLAIQASPEPAKGKKRKKDIEEEEEDEDEDEDKHKDKEQKTDTKTPEEQRRENLMLIALYLAKFPEKLGVLGIDKKHLSKKTDEELVKILDDIKFMLSCSTNSPLVKTIAGGLLKAWEIIGISGGLQIQGLKVTLDRDKEWQDLISEMELSYLGVSFVSVEKRMLFHLVNTSMNLDEINRLMSNLPPPDDSEIPANIVDTYKELE